MNKSEKKIRRETVNNYYVPPPARNRNVEGSNCYVPPPARNRNVDGSSCYVPPPARKLDGPECCAQNECKTKDRTLELKMKKAAEETKICNNSSLLFKTENGTDRPNQGNKESTSKKKKKKKKRKLSDESKSENPSLKGVINKVEKSVLDESSLYYESSMNYSEENFSESLLEVTQSAVNGHRELSPKAGGDFDFLDNKESPDNYFEMMNNFNQLSFHNDLGKKNSHIGYNMEVEQNGLMGPQERNSEASSQIKMGESWSSSETENILSTSSRRSSEIHSLGSPDEYEWEKLWDDGFQEFNIQNSSSKGVGEIEKCNKPANVSQEKETSDSCVIEIYGFPEEFKTRDILMSFSNFSNRGFKIRWVDNTHALGIFPTPSIAEEALNSYQPFVKTRPMSQASRASKEKAEYSLLPPAPRPKTCSALARRLVSGALGVRAVFTKEEREAEREILKEAREQKRLAAKQRDAAWEGKF